jgi:hypothetical protein
MCTDEVNCETAQGCFGQNAKKNSHMCIVSPKVTKAMAFHTTLAGIFAWNFKINFGCTIKA